MYRLVDGYNDTYHCANCNGTNFIPSEIVNQGHKCTSCRRGVDFDTITIQNLDKAFSLINSQNEERLSIASESGEKFDQDKPIAGALEDFDLALMELVKLLSFGAKKYERSSWLNVPNAEVRYKDALWRHLLDKGIDPETNLGHDVAVVFNALACLQLRLIKESNKET